MRILMGMLAIALLAAWGPVAPARAQCEPSTCAGSVKSKAAKTKPVKKMAAKKAKKRAKEEYLRAVPY